MPNPDCPPPPSARKPLTMTYSCTKPTVLPFIPDPCETLALADLVDISLQNSPKTRAAWYQAKQAAADVGIARGAYLPPIALNGFWIKEQFPVVETDNSINFDFIVRQRLLGGTISTSYLLFDFGGRNGNLWSAISCLDSLSWIYNWEVQSVMINTIQSYYDFIHAQAIVEADEATVNDHLTTVEAAVARRLAGATNLADELQAQTNLIQSQIFLEQDKGILNVTRATLAQALALPADTCLCVSGLPETLIADGVCQDMASIMQAAKENRADLMAMRSQVLERRFAIRSAKSNLMPKLTTNLCGGREDVNNLGFLDTFHLCVNLNIPLFNSFADINALRKSQAALLETQALLDDQELNAFLAVVSDYYELIANQQILKYSDTYLALATENQAVAYANYRAGITTIIDLMTANNALYMARRQLADAKTNFLASLANLAFDTGSLTVDDLLSLGPQYYPPWEEPCQDD